MATEADQAAWWSWFNSVLVLSLIPWLSTVAWRNLQRIQPHHLLGHRRVRWLEAFLNPYMTVTIDEQDYTARMMMRSGDPLYGEVKAYLGASCSQTSKVDPLYRRRSGRRRRTTRRTTPKRADTSKVTLSGLLNVVDGLLSACGEEQIFVFTTNHVGELDKALIRRGRMDKPYSGYEAFRFLAERELGVGSHDLFAAVKELLGQVEMTPADVIEELTLIALVRALVRALEEAKEEKANRGSTS